MVRASETCRGAKQICCELSFPTGTPVDGVSAYCLQEGSVLLHAWNAESLRVSTNCYDESGVI